MVSQSRAGPFSSAPAQNLQTGFSHSPHPAPAVAQSATASPNVNGTSSLAKIVVAQVYLLLSTFREDKGEEKADQLRKLIDDSGMEVYSKFLTRLVAGNAPAIFPGLNRPVANAANHTLLVDEMHKIGQDPEQASKIAESIEAGTEDIFRDFDLATFMEHFMLNALDKTALALAFKLVNKTDLRAKADAILSECFSGFVEMLSQPIPEGETTALDPTFVSFVLDRFVQNHPPTFNAASKAELSQAVQHPYASRELAPPAEILASLDVIRVTADKPQNILAIYMQRTGSEFTSSQEACARFLQARPSSLQLSEEQVSAALIYATISQSPQHDPSVLTAALRPLVPAQYRWRDVVSYFDQRTSRISSRQFLRLYRALEPIARADESPSFDIQSLWGGNWENPETQLSFICAYASLKPDELDASTIPGLQPSMTMELYADSSPTVRERAAYAIRHPLNSVAALSAIFHVALHSIHASQSIEAKRLFQEVVVPNLDIFVVSAFGVPKPWPPMAIETLNSLFDNFLYKRSSEYEYVLDSLWRRDREWVTQRLVDAHAVKPNDLPLIFDHALQQKWLDDLVNLPTGFGIDMAAWAHARQFLDLDQWAQRMVDAGTDIHRSLLQFLIIKTNMELQFQRPGDMQPATRASTTLHVRSVAAFLRILDRMPPVNAGTELVDLHRTCITVYPRLINYGCGYDDIIDRNGESGNTLPPEANAKMEEHYKRMYGDEMQVRSIVEVLDRYKHSQDPLEQDVFACMIHGLFDEYAHYVDYPLEALATTAVLFGGIISHNLISGLPLKIGLGMILEAVRDHPPENPMYKFGLQALMQLFPRFREWPGFCGQLLEIPGLQGTEAWNKAQEVARDNQSESTSGQPHDLGTAGTTAAAEATGSIEEEPTSADRQMPPFTSVNVDSPPPAPVFEEPSSEAQGRIQFALNNITDGTVDSMCRELSELLESKHQKWFASHLVEERAKMQPNYHHVYLELVNLLQDRDLWAQVLRETYVSVRRMLNSDATLQNSTERAHLKNLGAWLGLLTLARDKPIQQRNIAFKQLLLEALDTKRLIVVIPFVCKVLAQGGASSVFRPPNPWLMDMILLLIELYHHAELKLNLKFEIEVLCKGLSLDHRNIQPTGELLNRSAAEEPVESLVVNDMPLDTFDPLGANGIGVAIGGGLASHSAPPPTIPDLGPLIHIPPTNEMVVSASRLHDIVRSALTKALQDIIGPVVDRSVTIAAISTQQIIRKDFATEPDENRVRTSAINMVKATAGSLAMVTSKEPLRANLTNSLRNITEIPQGLPEGTILMCVNQNLELACSIIEKQAEEKAVPEIEEMIEPELSLRRQHRLARPNDPYADHSLSRWAMTIPNPFKLSPNAGGLNQEQMAIYDDFARHPRTAPTTTSHAASASDATRTLANEVLQETFSSVPSVPTPAETPSIGHLGVQMQPYTPLQPATATSGRGGQPFQLDLRGLAERVHKLLVELQRVASEAREDHFLGLPRPHAVLDVVDALVQLIIKTSQSSEDFATYTAEQICQLIFGPLDDNLALESLVHVLETLRRIGGPSLNVRVDGMFRAQPPHAFLNMPLLAALARTDLLDWRSIDGALAAALQLRKDTSLEFLELLVDMALLGGRPLVLYSDLVQTLAAAWAWVKEDAGPTAQRLRAKLSGSAPGQAAARSENGVASSQQPLMEYVFDEWVRLYANPGATEKHLLQLLRQMQARSIIHDKDSLFSFVRAAVEAAVDHFEHTVVSGGTLMEAYLPTDALSHFIVVLNSPGTLAGEIGTSRAQLVTSTLTVISLVLSHHHVTRGDTFNQKVFFRLLTLLLREMGDLSETLPDDESQALLVSVASRLASLGPQTLPGFAFGWASLLIHRSFAPRMIRGSKVLRAQYVALLSQMLDFVGDLLRPFDVGTVAKDLYGATLKLFFVLHHDFPEFVIANSARFCASVPPNFSQLLNVLLETKPTDLPKMPDPRNGSSKSDIMDAAANATIERAGDHTNVLRQRGLLDIMDTVLASGPSEDAIAHLARATREGDGSTVFGFVPCAANLEVMNAIILYTAAKAVQRGPSALLASGTEASTLSMLARELPPETRYFLLYCVANQLQYPCLHTAFFSQLLLGMFGEDLSDPEETDLRQQITRVLFERLATFWPHPWGLVLTVVELIKDEKYMFLELPFIKTSPEVVDRFAALLQRA